MHMSIFSYRLTSQIQSQDVGLPVVETRRITTYHIMYRSTYTANSNQPCGLLNSKEVYTLIE